MVGGSTAQANPVALGFGSNLGDRIANINLMEQMVIGLLMPPFFKSSLMETAPVGVALPQPTYYNQIFCGYFSGSAEDLLDKCQDIEKVLGRDKKGLKEPRTSDIDILLFGDAHYNDERLRIPHPQIFTRRFCLEGLNEVVPDWNIPGECLTIRELYATMDYSMKQQKLLIITGVQK